MKKSDIVQFMTVVYQGETYTVVWISPVGSMIGIRRGKTTKIVNAKFLSL